LVDLGCSVGRLFPIRHNLPFLDAYVVRHLADNLQVSFDFTNGSLFIASILFGFSSLIVVNKECVDRRICTVLLPPLILIVLTGFNQQLSFGLNQIGADAGV
jgi:hypothetical protein